MSTVLAYLITLTTSFKWLPLDNNPRTLEIKKNFVCQASTIKTIIKITQDYANIVLYEKVWIKQTQLHYKLV